MKHFISAGALLLLVGVAGYLVASWSEWSGGNERRAEPVQGGVYQVALDSDPPTLDPAMITDTKSMACALQIFDGLVRFHSNSDDSIAPALAESWSISEDQKRYTFNLRTDARFHAIRFDASPQPDGKALRVETENKGRLVEARDVKYSFERVLDPGMHSPRTTVLETILGAREFMEGRARSVDGIRILTPQRVEIELVEPYAPFLATLTMPCGFIVPREDVEADPERFARAPVGSGAFVFQSYEPGKLIRLRANRSYFDKRPYLDQIEFYIIPDEEVRFSKFLAGELHHSLVPDPHYPVIKESIRKDPESKWKSLFTEIPELGVYYFGLNLRVEPFDNLLVRRAFCAAIDKTAICRFLKSERVDEASSPLPTGLRRWIVTPSDEIILSYKASRARELLDQAGYPADPHSGVRTSLATIPIHIPVSGEHLRIAQAVQANLADIGVRSHIVANPWKDHLKILKAGKAGFFRLGWIADYKDADSFLYYNFHSRNINQSNYTGYANPEIDRLLEEARRNTDPEFRRDRYKKIDEIILRDAVWVCLFYFKTAIVRRPEVHGINLTELGEHMIRFHEVWLEPGAGSS